MITSEDSSQTKSQPPTEVLPHDNGLAEAKLARNRNRFPVVILRHLRLSLRKPMLAPRHLLQIIVLTVDCFRTRCAVLKCISAFNASQATVDLASHAHALSKCLHADEADRFIQLLAHNGLETALKYLGDCVAMHDPLPERLLYLVRKAQISIRWLRDGYDLPSRKNREFEPDHTRKNALFVFHSRGPLVNNGYAARSVESIDAVGAMGWRAEAVTRLGFPHDINRFRDAFVPERDTYGGVPCHLLMDPGDGQRGRAPDDYLAAYAKRLETEIQRTKATVIHAASNYLNGLAAAEAARNTGCAMVYEVRGLWELTALSRGDYDRDDARFRLAERMEAQAANCADAVITLSYGLKRELINRGVDADKISIAPNCVDFDRYGNESRDFALASELGLNADLIVGYFGAFVDYEGLDILLEALAMLKAKGTSIQALIVGGGPQEAFLRDRSNHLRLGASVRFLKKIPREKLERYAALCDIVSLPRRSTPVTEIVPPIKAVEAMARGHALVASDVGALRDLVRDGETGLVVNPEDPANLAEALERFSKQHDMAVALGTAAREDARKRFDKKTVGSIIHHSYELAIARSRFDGST